MNNDSELQETLHLTVAHAVSRMEALKNPSDRRSLFHEYKEWLREDFSDEVWAMSSDWSHKY